MRGGTSAGGTSDTEETGNSEPLDMPAGVLGVVSVTAVVGLAVLNTLLGTPSVKVVAEGLEPRTGAPRFCWGSIGTLEASADSTPALDAILDNTVVSVSVSVSIVVVIVVSVVEVSVSVKVVDVVVDVVVVDTAAATGLSRHKWLPSRML